MITLVEILFPVFGLMLLGGSLRQLGFVDSAMETSLNRFCYFLALPTFIVTKLATAPPLGAETLRISVALQAVTLAVWLLGLAAAPLFRVSKRSRGTFTQAGYRGNLAYVGLPVLAFALSDATPEEQNLAGAEAMLVIGSVVLLYNLLGVVSLEWDRRHEQGGSPLKNCLIATLKNPLVIACVLGLSWQFSGIPFPDLLGHMSGPVGATAFPLALIAIGSRIRGLRLGHFGLPILGVLLLKNVLTLGLAVLAAHLLHLEGTRGLILLILSATPTAVATYVIVDQLEGDRDLIASGIAVTTLFSMLSLSAALMIGL